MGKVTIQDIADALGVSRNTVSRAINQSGGIAEATRARILQKAVEMGYKQFSYVSLLSDAAGQSQEPALPSATGTIAMLTTTLFSQHHHFGIPMLDKFSMELSQLGYTMESYIIDSTLLLQRRLPEDFHSEKVDAIICVEMLDRSYGELICSLGLPVLMVDSPVYLDGYPLAADHLYMENTNAVTQIIRDGLNKGMKRFGFIGNHLHCQSFYERYTAFRMALIQAGLPVEEKFCIRHNNLEDQVAVLNSLTDFPDLFICANDFVAVGAMELLRKRGISVPQNVCFSGFDDVPESRLLTPALTTVHIHSQSMAVIAVQLLLSRIKEPSMNYRTLHTESTVIYRSSTNPSRIQEAMV